VFSCYNGWVESQSFSALLTPSGQALLAEVQACHPRESDYLAHFQAFSRRFPADLTQAALEIAIQRGRAVEKFPRGGELYFDRAALEQASPFQVAAYTARRYTGCSVVFDMGCAAGGDSLALADHAAIMGIDIDPLRLQMARANLSVLGLQARAGWTQADLTQLPFQMVRPVAGAGLFFDPARRRDGRRLRSVEAYDPPLSIIHTWLNAMPEAGVKLSPGVSLDELTGYNAAYSCEIEFISLGGDLKEALLWFGNLRTATRRATLLARGKDEPEPASLCLEPGERLPVPPVSSPQAYLYEPDAAVLRAGLVAKVAEQLQAVMLDRNIAYLTADRGIKTPYARCWAVQDWFPFQLKRLRAYLRARNIGRVTVKKRGSPLEPQDLIHQLRLQGDGEALIFLTHLEGKPIVIVADPIGL